MNIRFSKIYFLLLFIFSDIYSVIPLGMGCPSFKNTCDYPRAYISTFVPGTGQSRAWLSVIVGFDKPIPNDLFEKYLIY